MARIENFGDKSHTLTNEERAKGGRTTQQKLRERKTFKEELTALLSIDGNNEKVSLAVLRKALDGDISAFNTIRDTIGEKPVDKMGVEVSGNVIKVDIVDE